MDRDALILRTRALLGDLELEGNTTEVEDSDIVDALNFAQEQVAILTHCTYQQVTVAVSSLGLIDLSAENVLEIDRVMTPEPDPAPAATITVTGTPTAGTPFTAEVPAQDGAFVWSAAGATLASGQGTRTATFEKATAGPAVLSCAVVLAGKQARGNKAITVAEA